MQIKTSAVGGTHRGTELLPRAASRRMLSSKENAVSTNWLPAGAAARSASPSGLHLTGNHSATLTSERLAGEHVPTIPRLWQVLQQTHFLEPESPTPNPAHWIFTHFGRFHPFIFPKFPIQEIWKLILEKASSKCIWSLLNLRNWKVFPWTPLKYTSRAFFQHSVGTHPGVIGSIWVHTVDMSIGVWLSVATIRSLGGHFWRVVLLMTSD